MQSRTAKSKHVALERFQKFILEETGANIDEDMVAQMAPSSGTPMNPQVPGQFHQTPDSMPSGTMDVFSLAGPGRAKPGRKKKKTKSWRISNFKDFLKSKA